MVRIWRAALGLTSLLTAIIVVTAYASEVKIQEIYDLREVNVKIARDYYAYADIAIAGGFEQAQASQKSSLEEAAGQLNSQLHVILRMGNEVILEKIDIVFAISRGVTFVCVRISNDKECYWVPSYIIESGFIYSLKEKIGAIRSPIDGEGGYYAFQDFSSALAFLDIALSDGYESAVIGSGKMIYLRDNQFVVLNKIALDSVKRFAYLCVRADDEDRNCYSILAPVVIVKD